MSGFLKSLAALVVAGVSYVDNTYTPLIWVLAALVALDLIFNIHKEGKQFEKIGSAAASLGIPGFITSQFGMPHFTQYIVILLTIAYIQVVFPQIGGMLAKIRFSKNPTTQAVDMAQAQAVVAMLEAAGMKVVNQAEAAMPEAIRPAPVTPEQSKVE